MARADFSVRPLKEVRKMKCGKCAYCYSADACDYDCVCLRRSDEKIDFQVSRDDNIRDYGENDEPCELFEPAKKYRQPKYIRHTGQFTKKKFKDKRFAAKCSRDIIKQGFEMLGMEAGEVMQCCIDGMQAHKEELGF